MQTRFIEANGLRFEVHNGKARFNIESRLIGRINVYNILAACCVGLSYQFPIEIQPRQAYRALSIGKRLPVHFNLQLSIVNSPFPFETYQAMSMEKATGLVIRATDLTID